MCVCYIHVYIHKYVYEQANLSPGEKSKNFTQSIKNLFEKIKNIMEATRPNLGGYTVPQRTLAGKVH